jgi:hypothetical protein
MGDDTAISPTHLDGALLSLAEVDRCDRGKMIDQLTRAYMYWIVQDVEHNFKGETREILANNISRAARKAIRDMAEENCVLDALMYKVCRTAEYFYSDVYVSVLPDMELLFTVKKNMLPLPL